MKQFFIKSFSSHFFLFRVNGIDILLMRLSLAYNGNKIVDICLKIVFFLLVELVSNGSP